MEISEQMARTLRRVADIESRLEAMGASTGDRAALATTPFAEMVQRATPPAPDPSRTPPELQTLIAQAAQRYNLRPGLLRSVMRVESGFNARAVSPKGAMGLMQLMPGTAAALGVADPFNPEENVMAGARYLRQQLDQFGGDERLAVAAYNAGPGAVLRYHDVPPYAETRQYVDRVLTMAGSDAEADQP